MTGCDPEADLTTCRNGAFGGALSTRSDYKELDHGEKVNAPNRAKADTQSGCTGEPLAPHPANGRGRNARSSFPQMVAARDRAKRCPGSRSRGVYLAQS